MSASAIVRQSDLRRLAAVAKRDGVRVELEINGMIIRVSPDHSQPAVDASAESDLDRELAAFEAKHGYS
ncbi:hypothetical protein [Mycoplana ramosa]|uniref:Uncharacterized protein n=1 Tax=Mycoplana ramosa TaxID=40837 RepID=A0ABW3YWE7_MYCRA